MVSGSWEEREEIRELYARYALSIDDGRWEEWVECFTTDGVFESPRFGAFAGRDELRRFVNLYRTSLGGSRARHIVANVSFALEGGRGQGSCSFIYYHVEAGKPQLVAVGTYRDDLRQENGRWFFARRRVEAG